MREKWIDIDKDSEMFDFQDYYQSVAEKMPEGARIIEVGLSNARSIIFLCETLLNLGKTFRLIGVDNMQYGGVDQLNAIMSNIGKAGLGEYIEIMPFDSLVAATKFNDGYFHHVFLDSSHEYLPTRAEITVWYQKVIENYYLSGHDYNLYPGVHDAVIELLPQKRVFTEEVGIFESLEIIKTSKDFGVWSYRKSWQAVINIR